MITTKKLLQVIAEKDRAFGVERTHWMAERADLLNRINPLTASAPVFTPVEQVPEPYVFDDENYDPDYQPANKNVKTLMEQVMAEGFTE